MESHVCTLLHPIVSEKYEKKRTPFFSLYDIDMIFFGEILPYFRERGGSDRIYFLQ